MATNKKIDPRLYVPPVENYEYIDAETREFGEALPAEEITVPSSGSAGLLQPPETVTVVEQIVRKGADGRTVVDLVLEVEDMPGATEYEVRVALV